MRKKVGKTLSTLREYSVPLIAGVVGAVIWANLDHEGYEHFLHWSPLGDHSVLNFHFLMNDLFMALFFGIAAKEITESCLPGGALNPPRKAINPLLGTAGGVLGPVGVFFLYVFLTGESGIARGWGIPTATDIALAWLVARVAFGRGHPAISFLLLLAIADDAIGLGIIAIFYPDPNHPVQPLYLVIVASAIGLAWLLRRGNVRNFWVYLVGPGLLSWAGLYLAHLHPALALVPIVPFMPSLSYDLGFYRDKTPPESHPDTLNAFEHFFKKPVDVGLLGFGIANAGVVFSSVGPATWAVFLALFVGKTVGIFLFSAVGHLAGFKLPDGLDLRSLTLVGMTAGIGLTVALFVAGVAFTDPHLQGSAKMGALLSAGIGPLVIVLARLCGFGRQEQEEVGSELATSAVGERS